MSLSPSADVSAQIRTISDLHGLHQIPQVRVVTTISPLLLDTRIRRCEVLRDQGRDILNTPEDSLAIAPGKMGGALRFAVSDGVSGAYDYQPGPSTYGGLSGGRAVSEAFTSRICSDEGRSSLRDILDLVNSDAANVNSQLQPPCIHNDVSSWAGATGGIFELQGDLFRWVVWGDVRLLIETKQGDCSITWDGLEAHERDVEPILREMIRSRIVNGMEASVARADAWRDYAPIFRSTRCSRINADGPHAFGLLNGSAEFLSSAHILEGSGQVSSLRRAVLFTDGCILRSGCNAPGLARQLLELISSGGLHALIEDTRGKERGGATQFSHVSHAEGVAICIEFS